MLEGISGRILSGLAAADTEIECKLIGSEKKTEVQRGDTVVGRVGVESRRDASL